jgi:hypothetical protein
MAALGTRLAAVPRVDEFDRHSRQVCLVHDEAAELGKAPTTQPILGISAPGRNPLADPLEVLQGNPALGALGSLDDLLADDVTLMPAEPGFPPGNPPQFLLGSLGPRALESLALQVVFLPDRLDIISGVGLALAVGGEIGNPQVHSEKVSKIDRCGLGGLDGQEQQPLAIAEQQVSLSLGRAEPLGLIRPPMPEGRGLRRDGSVE